MLTCTFPDKELPNLAKEDAEESSFLSAMDNEGSDTVRLGDDATIQLDVISLVIIYGFQFGLLSIWGM